MKPCKHSKPVERYFSTDKDGVVWMHLWCYSCHTEIVKERVR